MAGRCLPYTRHGLISATARCGYISAVNPPRGAAIYFALKERPARPARLTIVDGAGKVIAELATVAVAGLHRAQWDLRKGGAPVPAGEHTARLQVGEIVLTKKFRVEAE